MAAVFLQRSRHRSVYYFRRKVPLDLRPVLGVSVIYKTLRTSTRGDAVVMARALAAGTDRLFSEARRMGKDNNKPLRSYYELYVDMDELTGRKRVVAKDIKPVEDERAAEC